MRKLCPVHGPYPYNSLRCPECKKQKEIDRAKIRDTSMYGYRWRKFRNNLRNHYEYSFCWSCFLDTSRLNHEIHYHHISDLNTYPELQYSVNNLVPLCNVHHGQTEAMIRRGEQQPDWKEVRQRVREKLSEIQRGE